MAHLGETVNARIKHFRLMNGLNMQELAERSGLSRAVVVNIERNRKIDLAFSELIAIAEALGVPLAALVYPIETPRARVMVGRQEMDVHEAVRALVGESGQFWEVHDSPAAELGGDLLDLTKQLEDSRGRIISLDANLLFTLLRDSAVRDEIAMLLSADYDHTSAEVRDLIQAHVPDQARADYALLVIDQRVREVERWGEYAKRLQALGGDPGRLPTVMEILLNTTMTSDGVDQAAT